MAKVTVVHPVVETPPPTVVLEMTLEEAKQVRRDLGRVSNPEHTWDLYVALADALEAEDRGSF